MNLWKTSLERSRPRGVRRIVQACRNTGKIPGLACGSAEDARRRAAQGFQFLTAGSDAGFLLAGAKAGLQALRA